MPEETLWKNNELLTLANEKTTLEPCKIALSRFSSFSGCFWISFQLYMWIWQKKKKMAKMAEVACQNPKFPLKSLSVCLSVFREIDWSQYFLPSLHVYIGRVLLVNIGLKQTLKSLITFKQTLRYSAADPAPERKKLRRSRHSWRLQTPRVNREKSELNFFGGRKARKATAAIQNFVFLKSGTVFSEVTSIPDPGNSGQQRKHG